MSLLGGTTWADPINGGFRRFLHDFLHGFSAFGKEIMWVILEERASANYRGILGV
jgi:hypothetical protein